MADGFVQRLQAGELLVSDGATGTNLQRAGLPPGAAPESWIMQAPEKVVELHRSFVEAGSDVILTNTFGATRLRLGREGGEQVVELNRRAVDLARQAVGSSPGVMVAGSLGPTGLLMAPLGPLTEQAALETYAEQAAVLAGAGADLLVVETMYDLAEAKAAIAGAQQASQLPIVCSFSFDRGSHTMMGVSPSMAVEALRPMGLAAMGANCGRSLEDAAKVLEELMGAMPDVPIWIKPNAGMPKAGVHPPQWDLDPQDMARCARLFVRAGARIVGGCCGTSPEHLRALAQAVRAEAELPSS